MARRTRDRVGLKHWLIVVAALTLNGCVSLEEQDMVLKGLRDEVRGLGARLDALTTSVNGIESNAQQTRETIDARLNLIDLALARPIEMPTPVCEFPELPQTLPEAVACEAPVESSTPIGIEKLTVGAVERVRITPQGIILTARIDSGADSSSLSATTWCFLSGTARIGCVSISLWAMRRIRLSGASFALCASFSNPIPTACVGLSCAFELSLVTYSASSSSICLIVGILNIR